MFYSFADVLEFEERLRRHFAKWLREHHRTFTTRMARERARVPEIIAPPKPYIAPGIVAVAEAADTAPGSESSKGAGSGRG